LAAEPSIVLCLDFPENYGSLDDYLQEYEDGLMTAEAKAIYEAILENGPLVWLRWKMARLCTTLSLIERSREVTHEVPLLS